MQCLLGITKVRFYFHKAKIVSGSQVDPKKVFISNRSRKQFFAFKSHYSRIKADKLYLRKIAERRKRGPQYVCKGLLTPA